MTPAARGVAMPGVEPAATSPSDPSAESRDESGSGADQVLRAMPGRTTSVRTLDGVPRVRKDFVGDEPRDWWFERLHRWRPRSPAERERAAWVALAELGLVPRVAVASSDFDPVPRWSVPRPGRGARSRLELGWVDHRCDAAAWLAEQPSPERLEAILAVVVGLHRAGWYHRDLYLCHLVVGLEGQLWVLDLGRARHQPHPRRRWFVKDLAALELSAPARVSRAARLRWLKAWLAEVLAVAADDRATRRAWVERVTAKARRLAAHRPRHSGDPMPTPGPRAESDGR